MGKELLSYKRLEYSRILEDASASKYDWGDGGAFFQKFLEPSDPGALLRVEVENLLLPKGKAWQEVRPSLQG